MRILSTGAIRFNTYGSGTFTGTAAKWLAVDASGNLIEQAAPSGTGTVTSVGSGWGTNFSAITGSGSVVVDSLTVSSKAWRQKGDDSLAAIFAPKASPTLTGITTMNSKNEGLQSVATAAGTTTLTSASPTHTVFTGATTQTLVLPDASTLAVGQIYYFHTQSTGAITLNTNGGLS